MSDARGRATGLVSRMLQILVLAALLFVTAIRWGLPEATSPETVQPWALDTIAPIAPLNEAYYGFTRAGNEFVVYPLFHYAVLAGAYAPYIGLQFLTGSLSDPAAEFPYGIDDIGGFARDLTLIARLVSVIMAIGIVFVLYRMTLAVAGRTAANWAALATTLIAPLGYYAKTSNLDVPYIFWVCLAVWRFLCILERPKRRDFVLLGVFAALAVATKDQAYGFFVLIPPILVYRLAIETPFRTMPPGMRWLRATFSAPVLLGGTASALTYAMANNLFFGGLGGWLRHLSYGGDLYGYRSETEASFYSIGTQLDLLGDTMLILLAALGPITILIAALGIGMAVRERRYRLLSLLVIAFSYYVCVIAVFNLVFSRYLLAVMILLMPFFGLAADRLRNFRGWGRSAGLAAILLALGTQAAFVVNLNMTLLGDSRQAMEYWIRNNVPPGSVIESPVRERLLPRVSAEYRIAVVGNSGDPITMLVVPDELTPGALAMRNPDYVLMLEGLGVTGDPATWETQSLRDYYAALIDGQLGYEIVADFHTPHFLPFRQIPGTRPRSILLARQDARHDD